MAYQPRITRCRLHTGGKSIAELRERYKGQGLTYRDLESVKRSLDLFDGVELFLSQWEFDGGVDYHIHGWNDDVDERVMEATYEAEQTHPMPQYKGKKEAFIADWKAGEYDPGCPFIFWPGDVEELEVMQEEEKEEPAEDGEEEKKPPRWRQIKEKQARKHRHKRR